ncbi:hypothetical protein, partial [Salmonella enterica]|uniref:hypothetical protein n=1 Tax=Salmonella enterica TaxID=28901 RepID=UPI001A9C8BB7
IVVQQVATPSAAKQRKQDQCGRLRGVEIALLRYRCFWLARTQWKGRKKRDNRLAIAKIAAYYVVSLNGRSSSRPLWNRRIGPIFSACFFEPEHWG